LLNQKKLHSGHEKKGKGKDIEFIFAVPRMVFSWENGWMKSAAGID
jgi:hypothetical protein